MGFWLWNAFNLRGSLCYGAEIWHGDTFSCELGLCRVKNRKKSVVSGKNRTYCRLPYKKDIFQHHSLAWASLNNGLTELSHFFCGLSFMPCGWPPTIKLRKYMSPLKKNEHAFWKKSYGGTAWKVACVCVHIQHSAVVCMQDTAVFGKYILKGYWTGELNGITPHPLNLLNSMTPPRKRLDFTPTSPSGSNF